MANTNIDQLPVAVSVDESWYIPIQGVGQTTKRATVTDIVAATSGFVPSTAYIRAGTAITITDGGLLVDNPIINWTPGTLQTANPMDVADSFMIVQNATQAARQVTFPNSMKALTGLTALNFPDPVNDYLIINHAADGETYKVNTSSISLTTGNMPAGGTTGQILTKASSTNYDTTWTSGGFLPQVANSVFAGPTSGAAADPAFRALVGADLPNPGASSKGGVQSFSAVTHQFLTQISTSGVVSAAQPAFTDISGTAGVAQGGTGLTSYTTGDLIYASGTTTLAKLADVATGNVILSGGVGVAPSWGKVDLTSAVSGTLPVGNGGTGQTTLAAHGVVIGNGSSGVSVTGTGTSGQILTSNGASADPTFQTATSALGQALTKVDDTNVTLTLGGAPTTALLSATSITAGWTGTLSGARGGTGVANTGKTITLGGSLTTSGAFDSTFTMTGITSVTFPTSGTLATTAGASIPSIAQGDLLYGSATNVLSALAKSTSATRYLSNTGSSNNPAWAQVDLTTGVTGTLPVASGGTGATSFTNYAVLCGGTLATNPVQSVVSVGTSGQVLTSNGAGALPTFQSLSAVGQALTKVDDTNVTLTLGGTPTTALLAATSITAGWTGTLAVGRGGTGASSFTSFGVLYGNNTSAIQVTAAGTSGQVLGGNTGVAPSMRSLSAVMDDAFSTAQGSLVFRGASAWTAIAPGTAGFVLSSNGAAADPTWISVSGVGTVTSVNASGGTTGLTFSGGPITGAGTLTMAGTLGTANGGTNLTSYTQGDILYASSSSVISKLAKDTNATRYLSNTGATNNPAWAQVDLTNGVTGVLPLANGGTNANLTASNGGIFYSTASAGAILAGTATAGQILRSGSSVAPSWSTSTYPATSSAGTVLVSATANTITATATPTFGVAGATQGSLALAGATSNAVTIQVQAAAGNYNFNLPTSAGTSGQPLLSGGGGSTAMSFGTLGIAGGGTGVTTGAFLKTKINVFSASGTYTPTTGMIYCIIECVGGGGSGGGAAASGAGNQNGAGGGGGGEYTRKVATAATIGASQTVTIGAGGSAPAAGNNNGNSGGTTSVGTVATAAGGAGGGGAATGASRGNGGAGGTGGTSDFAIPGQAGGNGESATITTVVFNCGGFGGASHFGYGPGPSAAASAGLGYGGGGSGGNDFNNISSRVGGAGSNGVVVITEFLNQ